MNNYRGVFKADSKRCAECTAVFFRPFKISAKQWERRNFCGYQCSHAAHRRALLAASTQADESLWPDRFWSKVDKTNLVRARPELEPCWPWTGARSDTGYGVIRLGGVLRMATHAALWIETGRWPSLQALHECDNPPCVRISHLREGTQVENMQDCIKRGRSHNRVQWRAA